VLRWLAGETAGQCGPCVHGLAAIAGAVETLAAGHATGDAVNQLMRWGDQVEGRGACSFPDGAVQFMRSMVRVFGADIQRHIQRGPCRPPVMPVTLPIPATPTEEWR
jgi:NADH:ubiquinone oxidoreductase subunit F (NADH-binding)